MPGVSRPRTPPLPASKSFVWPRACSRWSYTSTADPGGQWVLWRSNKAFFPNIRFTSLTQSSFPAGGRFFSASHDSNLSNAGYR
jgi:hypothetical protein